MVGKVVLSVALGNIKESNLSDKKKLTIEMLIRDRVRRGDSLVRASALAGNAMQESKGDSSIKQGNSKKSDKQWFKKTKAGRGTGLMQWDDRRFSLKKFAEKQGDDWRDPHVQLEFLNHEIEGAEKKSMSKVSKKEDIVQQTKDVSKYFLRPGKPHNEKRIKHAKRLLKKYKNIPEEVRITKAKSSMYTLPESMRKNVAKKKLEKKTNTDGYNISTEQMDKLRKESKSYMEFQEKLDKFKTDAEKNQMKR